MKVENSSILKDSSFISQQNQQIQQASLIHQPIQQLLLFPFPPLLLPSLPPPTPPPSSFPPLLPPVIHVPLLFPPRIQIPFSLTEGLKTYKLKPKILIAVTNHKIQTQERKDEPNDLDDPYDFDIDENNFNIRYVNPEESDDLDEENDFEIKVDDYLNEIPEEEVLENNDKNENYTFNIEKMKYESKIPGKRILKHNTITTYDKYMDKLKRVKREVNLEQKILKCFYPEEFKIENYKKGNEDHDYWHKNF
jgi:hypothetical protein